MTTLTRSLSVLVLALAAAGCTGVQPAMPEKPQARTWSSETGASQMVFLTLYDDGLAELHVWGPPRSVNHWGELEFPQETRFGIVRQIGARTFLIFDDKHPHLIEIAGRSGDHLAVWLYAADAGRAPETDAKLLALAGASRKADLELTLLRQPDPQPDGGDRPAPAGRFAI